MAYLDVKRWSLGTVCVGSNLANAGLPGDGDAGANLVLGKVQFGTPATGAGELTAVWIPQGMNVIGLEVFYQTAAATAGPKIMVRKGTVNRTTGDAETVTLIDYDATGATPAAGDLVYTAVDSSTTVQTNVGVRDAFDPYDGGTTVTSFAETLDVFLDVSANVGATTSCWAVVTVLYT